MLLIASGMTVGSSVVHPQAGVWARSHWDPLAGSWVLPACARGALRKAKFRQCDEPCSGIEGIHRVKTNRGSYLGKSIVCQPTLGVGRHF